MYLYNSTSKLVSAYFIIFCFFFSHIITDAVDVPSRRSLLDGLSAQERTHAFYYLWYGSPETDDGSYYHWNHEILPHWNQVERKNYPFGVPFNPPHCLHSPYYPLRGPYSSKNPQIIRQHLKELSEHNVGVIAASWWGPRHRVGAHDTQGMNTDERLEILLTETAAFNAGNPSSTPIRVALHLEPYEGRTIQTVYEDLQYLHEQYGKSPALFRLPAGESGRPVMYVYDSYRIPAADWIQLLGQGQNEEGGRGKEEGSRTDSSPSSLVKSIRGSPLDAVLLGLWLNEHDGVQLYDSGFDGFYTYFAAESTSFASQPGNWPRLQKWADDRDMIFSASVSPGYDDRRIRPWNSGSTSPRNQGLRYASRWDSAIQSDPDWISITSYNEWGEGTQIEPAVPYDDPPLPAKCLPYESYRPQNAMLYVDLTKYHVDRWGTKPKSVRLALAGKKRETRKGEEGGVGREDGERKEGKEVEQGKRKDEL